MLTVRKKGWGSGVEDQTHRAFLPPSEIWWKIGPVFAGTVWPARNLRDVRVNF
jgi:hypothetical protein